MYRELTAAALAADADLDDGAALAALVDTPPPPGSDLRAEAISRHVSAVSRHPQVREAMRGRQRAQAVDAVLEGRDTGSVVCPDPDLKISLVASAGVRAARRAAELACRWARSNGRSSSATSSTPSSWRRHRTPW
jgi:cytidylate kinase